MCSKVHRMLLLLLPTIIGRGQIETNVRVVWILLQRALHHLASIQFRARDRHNGPPMKALRSIASLNTPADCYLSHNYSIIVVKTINGNPVFSMTDEKHLRNRDRTLRLPGCFPGVHATAKMLLTGEYRKLSHRDWRTC